MVSLLVVAQLAEGRDARTIRDWGDVGVVQLTKAEDEGEVGERVEGGRAASGGDVTGSLAVEDYQQLVEGRQEEALFEGNGKRMGETVALKNAVFAAVNMSRIGEDMTDFRVLVWGVGKVPRLIRALEHLETVRIVVVVWTSSVEQKGQRVDQES